MVAFRPHLAVGTPGVVLVVPVVAGVLIGGGWAGVVGATAGFLAYDIFFVPPFGTLRVGNSNGWVALAASAAVVALVTRMVLVLRRAREEADRRGADAQRLYELSDALIGPQELGDVLRLVVSTLHEAFEPRWVALALPE